MASLAAVVGAVGAGPAGATVSVTRPAPLPVDRPGCRAERDRRWAPTATSGSPTPSTPTSDGSRPAGVVPRTSPSPRSMPTPGASPPGPTGPCGSPSSRPTRSGASPPPAVVTEYPLPLRAAARSSSPPGRTAPCGSPRRVPAGSGASHMTGHITEFAIPGPNRGAEEHRHRVGRHAVVHRSLQRPCRAHHHRRGGDLRESADQPGRRGGPGTDRRGSRRRPVGDRRPGPASTGSPRPVWSPSSPTRRRSVAAITAGPDGALWLSCEVPGEIQRVTTSGAITTVATISGQGGRDHRRPDHSLWWTVLNPGEVDSIQLGDPGLPHHRPRRQRLRLRHRRVPRFAGQPRRPSGLPGGRAVLGAGRVPAGRCGRQRLRLRRRPVRRLAPVPRCPSDPAGRRHHLDTVRPRVPAGGGRRRGLRIRRRLVSRLPPGPRYRPEPSGDRCGHHALRARLLVGGCRRRGLRLRRRRPSPGRCPAWGSPPTEPIVGIAAHAQSATATGWSGADGGVYALGDAGFYGSAPGVGGASSPVVGIEPTSDGAGYWLAEDRRLEPPLRRRRGLRGAPPATAAVGRHLQADADDGHRPPGGPTASVGGRVRGEPGDERQRAALAAQHPAPQSLGVGRDGITGLRRHHVPRSLLDLVLELPRLPAGVAGEQARPDDRIGHRRRVAAEVDGADGAGRRRSGVANPRDSPAPPSVAVRRSASRTRPIRASRDTGPPVNSSAGAVARSCHCGSSWSTATPPGRSITTPIAPWSPWSSTRMTRRQKLGSSTAGVATSRHPVRSDGSGSPPKGSNSLKGSMGTPR